MDVPSNGLISRYTLIVQVFQNKGCGYPPLLCLFPAIEVAEDLRRYILEIYDDFLSPDGTVRW